MENQWELIVFTLFVCLGAGTFAFQGVLALLGRGRSLQLPCLIVSLASIAIGGIGSFLHLQHWERIFNGFGHLTSGITQELIAIVVFVAVLVVYFVVLRRSEGGRVPVWCGVLAVVASAVLVIIMAHSYNMAARPAWDTPLLWLYYLANAALLGSLAVACIAGIKSAEDVPATTRFGTASGIVAAAVTAIYGVYFSFAGASFTDVGLYFDPTHPTKAMADPASAFTGIFSGDGILLFWIGAVIVGAVVPAIVSLAAKKREGASTAALCGAGLACALVGGVCFRVILYQLGFSVFVFY